MERKPFLSDFAMLAEDRYDTTQKVGLSISLSMFATGIIVEPEWHDSLKNLMKEISEKQ